MYDTQPMIYNLLVLNILRSIYLRCTTVYIYRTSAYDSQLHSIHDLLMNDILLSTYSRCFISYDTNLLTLQNYFLYTASFSSKDMNEINILYIKKIASNIYSVYS